MRKVQDGRVSPTSPLIALPFILSGCGLNIMDPARATGSVTAAFGASSSTRGLIQSALTITPTVSTSAGTIVSCQIKPGSANASSFPSTLSIDSSTCKITGTPTASLATTEFTLEITNSLGATTTATFSLTISSCDVTASPFGSGAGNSGSPYLICSNDQLNQVRNYLSSYFKLETNLDLSSYSLSPLSAAGTPFTGNFDGNNYSISNWSYSAGATSTVGLFGLINSSAVVKNVNLANVSLSATGNNLGGLVGQMAGTSSVTNVIVSGSVTGGTTSSAVGLVIGSMSGTSSLDTASSSGTVQAQANLGGVIGSAAASGGTITITKIASSATVTGINGAAGGTYPTGGAIGSISGSAGAIVDVSKSYSTGAVSGNNNARTGGFLGEGFDNGGTVRVSNSYSTATVSNNNTTSAGGFVGRLGNAGGTAYLTNVYATGLITTSGGTSNGVMGGGGTSTGSYYNSETTGAAGGGGTATGKTTAELQDSSTFSGWNFTTIWNAPSASVNNGYPTLK